MRGPSPVLSGNVEPQPQSLRSARSLRSMSSPAIHDADVASFPVPQGRFTGEQARFLEDFFSALRHRTPLAQDADPEAAKSETALFHGTPVDELCREEVWKYEQNPLDLWDKL